MYAPSFHVSQAPCYNATTFHPFLTGGGVQGTAMAPPAIAAAGLAVAQWEWHTILPANPLRPGYKDRCVHFFEVPPQLQATR